MNKEKILAKSRASGQDEGIDFAVDKGIKGALVSTNMVGLILIVISFFTEQFLVLYALLTLVGAANFGEFFSQYRYFKQKRYVVGFVLFGFIFGGIFAFLFVRELGILQGWWG
jgi:hypothetical protein